MLDEGEKCDYCDRLAVDGRTTDCSTQPCSYPEHVGWEAWCEEHEPDA